ncbi:MAG: hypothetical protein SH848_18090 [Saprospiraceae bacterium]|nr:hypothetical protein [Saprospiraceae bacterium]MDZ4705843.1 hypothetical protein [Saprospiraceae bacterium]
MAKRAFLPSAPSMILWAIALIIGILGILVHYVRVDGLSKYNYEMLLIGFVLLVVGTAFRKV